MVDSEIKTRITVEGLGTFKDYATMVKSLDYQYRQGKISLDQLNKGLKDVEVNVSRLNPTLKQSVDLNAQIYQVQQRSAIGFKSLGGEINKITQLYKTERSENRMRNFLFRESKDVVMGLSMAYMALSSAGGDANKSSKKLNETLMTGFSTFMAADFAVKGFATALGFSTGGIATAVVGLLGVGAALLTWFSDVDAVAKKAAEGGVKDFAERFGGLSKGDKQYSAENILSVIKTLENEQTALYTAFRNIGKGTAYGSPEFKAQQAEYTALGGTTRLNEIPKLLAYIKERAKDAETEIKYQKELNRLLEINNQLLRERGELGAVENLPEMGFGSPGGTKTGGKGLPTGRIAGRRAPSREGLEPTAMGIFTAWKPFENSVMSGLDMMAAGIETNIGGALNKVFGGEANSLFEQFLAGFVNMITQMLLKLAVFQMFSWLFPGAGGIAAVAGGAGTNMVSAGMGGGGSSESISAPFIQVVPIETYDGLAAKVTIANANRLSRQM